MENSKDNKKETPVLYHPAIKSIILICLMFVGFLATIIGIVILTLSKNENVLGNGMYIQLLLYEIVPICIYLLIYRKEKVKEILSLKKISITNIFFVIGLHITILPLVLFTNALSLKFTDNVISESIEGMNFSYLQLFFIIGILGPILEEFIFRGILFNITKKLKLRYMAILSGFLFGAFHMNLNQFSYAFLLGAVFTIYVAYTGSILSAIISHIILNSFSVLVMYATELLQEQGVYDLAAAESETLSNSELMYFAIFSGMFFIIFLFILKFFKKYNIENNENCIYYKNKHIEEDYTIDENVKAEEIL